MKLAKITTINDLYYPQLRWILNDIEPTVVEHTIFQLKKVGRNYREPRPIPYIFIESVLNSNVLSESTIEDLFKTGIAKLRNALAPSTSEDLDYLLRLMAPTGGGINAVEGLIKQAGESQGTILQNAEWWVGLFAAFNIMDQETKTEVQQLVQQNLLEPDVVDAEAVEPVDAEAVPPAGDLEGKRAAVNDRVKSLLSRLEKLKAARKAGSPQADQAIEQTEEAIEAEILPSQSSIDGLLNQGATGNTLEHVVRDLVGALLNEHSVRTNIGSIGNIMLKNIGSPHCVRMPIISEAGLLDRLRNAVANPQQAAQGIVQSGASSDNQRAAKLAVKTLTDKLRTNFNSVLSANGLSPDQIMETLSSLGDMGGQERASAIVLLKKAMRLFGTLNEKPAEKPPQTRQELQADRDDPLSTTPETAPTAPPVQAPPVAPQPQEIIDPRTAHKMWNEVLHQENSKTGKLQYFIDTAKKLNEKFGGIPKEIFLKELKKRAKQRELKISQEKSRSRQDDPNTLPPKEPWDSPRNYDGYGPSQETYDGYNEELGY